MYSYLVAALYHSRWDAKGSALLLVRSSLASTSRRVPGKAAPCGSKCRRSLESQGAAQISQEIKRKQEHPKWSPWVSVLPFSPLRSPQQSAMQFLQGP